MEAVELRMEVVVETAGLVEIVDFAWLVELIDLVHFADFVALEEQGQPM